MSKAILERSGLNDRKKFVSPSVGTDYAKPVDTSNASTNIGPIDLKQVAGAFVGLLFLRRFPKTAVFGALAFGMYYGYSLVGGNSKSTATPQKKQPVRPSPFQGVGLADLSK